MQDDYVDMHDKYINIQHDNVDTHYQITILKMLKKISCDFNLLDKMIDTQLMYFDLQHVYVNIQL